MSQTKNEAPRRFNGVITLIIASCVSILLGVLLLFVPQVDIQTLCYIFCGALIAIGIAAIVIFFLGDSVKSMHGFGFAIGVALVILGCCTMLRAGDVIRDLTLYMGLLALILGITQLQNAVQLHFLHSKLWIIELILTVITLLGAIFVLADFRAIIDSIDGFVYWVMLIAGAASLIGMLLMAIGLRGAKRRESKEGESALAATAAQAASTIAESAASAVPEPAADTSAEPAVNAAVDSADEILSAPVEQPTLTFDAKPEPNNIPEVDNSTAIDPGVSELLDDSSINLDPPDLSK